MNICTGPFLLSVFKRPMYSIWTIFHSFHECLETIETSPGLSPVRVVKSCCIDGAPLPAVLCSVFEIVAFRCWSANQRRYFVLLWALQPHSPGAASVSLARR